MRCNPWCFAFATGRGVFLSQARPLNSFLVEYSGQLISAEEGYRRESELDDDSVFRYFVQYKRKQMW